MLNKKIITFCVSLLIASPMAIASDSDGSLILSFAGLANDRGRK